MSKSDSISRSTTDSSPGPPPLDHGLLSPEETQEHDVTHREDMDAPGDVADDAMRDLKGKGKASEQILSPIFPGQIYYMDQTPRSALKDYAPVGAGTKEAYLSPPLTVSEKFRFRVENLSWVFRRGLGSTLDFDVDLGLESGSEGSWSPGGASSVSSVGSGPEEGFVDAAFEEAISEEEEEEEEKESLNEGESFLSSSSMASTVEATSSRRATIGDTTLQDPGSVAAVVRFPSIFMQDEDISTLASSTEAGGSTPLAVFPYPLPDRGPNADDEVWRTLAEDLVLLKSGDDKGGRTRRRTENYAEVRVKHATKRTLRRRRRWKVQEKRLCKFSRISSLRNVALLTLGFLNTARDFFLIITLCFGMACAGILVLRPAVMAFFGYGTLGGRLEYD